MSLNVSKVWLKTEDQEVLVPASKIKAGDRIVIRMGTVIPFDGDIVDGEAMINQASLTWRVSVLSARRSEGYAYAGTVVLKKEAEESQVKEAKQVTGNSRFDKIVTMIEESEKLKSAVESKAEHLADQSGTVYAWREQLITYLLTRNVTKALICPDGRFLVRA